MQKEKKIVMLGTKADACGGIASVIRQYEINGLFERQPIIYLPTHCTGPRREKCSLFFSALWQMVMLIVQGKVAIVHAHVACDTSFWRKSLFLIIARVCRVPTILHLHSGHFPDFYRERCSRLSKAIVRLLLNNVQHVAVVSNALNAWIRTISKQTSVVTILNPAVICDTAGPAPRDTHTLLFLGHLGRAKGTYDLIHAMSAVARTVPDATLLLCGDGDVEGSDQLIAQLSLDGHVKTLGWVDPETRLNLLGRASVCVLPSYAEGLPMSVLEAMAQEVPVVATRVGGIPEAITHGCEGLLIEPGDVPALADSIVRLLEQPGERKRMGQAGRAKVENTFTADKTISTLETLYDQIRQQSDRSRTVTNPDIGSPTDGLHAAQAKGEQ